MDDEPDGPAIHSAIEEVRQYQAAPDHEFHPQADMLRQIEPGTRLHMQVGTRAYRIEWEGYDAAKDIAIFRMRGRDHTIVGQFKPERGSDNYVYWMPLYGNPTFGTTRFQVAEDTKRQ